MKKFFVKIIKTFVVLYLLLFSVQFILDYLLSKENSCNNNTWHKIYSGKLDADIVVLGTSRAEAHYDTQIMHKVTGLKTYNLGISGTHLDILKIRWYSYLKRNSIPKILILDLDIIALQDSKEIYGKFQYLPFFYSEEYRSVAKNIDQDYYYEMLIPLYKYRGYEMNIFNQIKSHSSPLLCSNAINGYVEHDIKWIEKDYENFKKILKNEEKVKVLDATIYYKSLKVLNDIVADCKKNKIKVYFIWSPTYYESNAYQLLNKKYVDSVLKCISKRNNIDYLNFSNDTLCLDKKYFYNSAHLNKNGATVFSKKIGEIINKKKP